MFKTEGESVGQRARNVPNDQSQLFSRWLDLEGHKLALI